MKTIILSCILFGYSLGQEVFGPNLLIPVPGVQTPVVIAPPAAQQIVNLVCDTQDACKDLLEVYVSSDTISTDCSGRNGCIKSIQNYGEAPGTPSPPGFSPGPYDSLLINCNGENSCANSLITIEGDYVNGIRIEATGLSSLASATITVIIPVGTPCKIVCGGTDVNSCLGLTITDNTDPDVITNACKCIGASCPLFPLGTDPPGEVTLGLSPNRPDDVTCIAETDDNPPDECRLPGPEFFPGTTDPFPNGHPTDGKIENVIKESSLGELICETNWDCCLCLLLDCNDCKVVNCGGDQGCIGTQIDIDGNSASGGSLNCNGDASCRLTTVTGQNVVGVLCDGDISCEGASLTLNSNGNPDNLGSGLRINCNGDGSCEETVIDAKEVDSIVCTGDNSCLMADIDLECPNSAGCPVTCQGDESCRDSNITVVRGTTNGGASSVNCGGDNACQDSILEIECLSAGCFFACSGDNSCQDSVVELAPATTVSCSGDEGCSGSNFNIDCASLGCPLTCGGELSCFEAEMEITNVKLVSCSGEEVCQDSKMNLTCVSAGCPVTCLGRNGCNGAELSLTNAASVMCGGVNGCTDAKFDFTDTMGGSISCGGMEVCLGASFLGITNMAMISCTGASACQDGTITGVSVSDVSLSCSGTTNACKNLEYINLDRLDGATILTPPVRINGSQTQILCEGADSCNSAKILTKCNDKDGCKFTCSGVSSCFGLNNGGIYGVFEMACTNVNSCGGDMNTIGIRNGFLLNCASGACNSTTFTFVVDPLGSLGAISTDITAFGTILAPNNEQIVTSIKGPECAAADACKDTTFTFKNEQIGQSIDVGLIKCGATGACMNTKFIFEGDWNVNAATFSCPNVDCSEIQQVIVNGNDITATLPTGSAVAVNKGIANIGGGYWFIIVSGSIMVIVLSVFAAKYFKNKKLKQIAMEKEMDENQKKKKYSRCKTTS